MRISRLMPACTGGHHTSVMPGTPARSSTFQAAPARMIEEVIAFSEYDPGSAPSMVPRRIVAVRDGGDPDGRLGHAVAREIAGELGEGPFHLEGRGVEIEIAFDHDLGARRDVEVHRLAFDEIDLLARA